MSYSPSKMLPMIPGPSSTDSGFPVRRTGSPTVTPAVWGQGHLVTTLKFECKLHTLQCNNIPSDTGLIFNI